MNSLEKAILEKLKTSLEESTKTSWTTGDLEDWAEWAKEMRTTISNSVSTMNAILNEPTTEEKEKN